ncbi:putative mitochondrial import receptor subunit TOM70 [Apostichopus japonicus]|uniref:Putative mitochondrial import receptor subunit TOM70 n=1 Tax=Stichopus japonicus TaxID=307972 RepID=A0A2G8K5L9_STIJA|nr:putative mitochondrial import receptor subunit TOM70 [Apostichopus japonicus]
MAANARPTSEGGLSKWQIAVAIGAPLAVGLAVGAYFYTRKGSEESLSMKRMALKQRVTERNLWKNQYRHLQKKLNLPRAKAINFSRLDNLKRPSSTTLRPSTSHPKKNKQDLSTFYQKQSSSAGTAGKVGLRPILDHRSAIWPYGEGVPYCFWCPQRSPKKNFQEVIEDCSKALELNSKYVKALFRRAKAFEMVQEKMKCLEDTTAVCILEGFGHQAGMFLADKMLKELGKEKASQAYKERQPTLPSGQFIRSYFSSFSNDGITSNTESYMEGEDDDSGFLKAVKAFQNGDYTDIIELCTEEIDTNGIFLPPALLMRASFLLLKGQAVEAKPDLDKLIAMEDSDKKLRANALIKRGSMYMQEGNALDAMDVFASAVRIDPDNADIYHHRGQLNLLLEKVDDAVKDFEKCQSLNAEFGLAYAQYCYARYRLAILQQSPMQMQEALKQLEECTVKFSTCAEGFALHAQALNDQGQFARADENFQKAIDIEPDNPTAHVHRGLLQLAWKKEPEAAVKLIKKALEIDERCDFAYETLGTIEVQRGNLSAAQGYFDKAIKLARTEIEMAHLYSLSIAAEAQDKVTKKYAITPPKQPFM